MDVIYTWIKNIVVYMIINSIVMNLLGNKSYKKYVSVVSGMILVLIVVSPLMNYMKLDESLDFFMEANSFAVETSDFKNDLNRMEEEQTDAIFAEYKSKIRLQVEEMLLAEEVSLKSFDITIDRNNKSPTFGEIIRMDITAELEDKEAPGQGESYQIDEVTIDRISLGDEAGEASQTMPSPLEIHIKNKLSDFYYIEQGNINISIQGG